MSSTTTEGDREVQLCTNGRRALTARRPVHPLPRQRLRGSRGAPRWVCAASRLPESEQGDLAVDPASRRGNIGMNGRLSENEKCRCRRAGADEEVGEAEAEETSGAIQLSYRALRLRCGAGKQVVAYGLRQRFGKA